MRITDVDVIISVSAQSGRVGAWYPLIYVAGTEETAVYKEYSSLAEIVVDYAETTDAYKAANLLFMQGEEYAPNKIAICKGGSEVMTNLAPYMDKEWRQLIVVGADYDKTIAEAIETSEKMYFTHFASQAELSTAKITAYDRIFAVVYTGSDVPNPEAAMVGRIAGLSAGSATYHAKPLKGVNADTFTQTELDAIHTAGGIAYVLKNGRVATSEGIVGSGEYADIIDSKDYIVQNIRYDVQEVFLNNEKIPYTNEGIAKIENAVLNVLARAYNNGMIADNEDGTPAYKTNFVLRSETSTADRASRNYPYGKFEFELSGAIHKAKITGSIVA